MTVLFTEFTLPALVEEGVFTFGGGLGEFTVLVDSSERGRGGVVQQGIRVFFVFLRVVVITGAFYVILIDNVFVNNFPLLTMTAEYIRQSIIIAIQ